MKTSMRPSSMTIGNRDLRLPDGLAEDLVEAGIEAELLGGQVEPGHHLFEGVGGVRALGVRPDRRKLRFGDLAHAQPLLLRRMRPPSLEWAGDCNAEGVDARLRLEDAEARREGSTTTSSSPASSLARRSFSRSLVRRYQARVLSHVARMIGNRDDALDLSQEIFVKVFQALDRYNPEYKFSTWLFRIAGNAAIDHLRKRRPRTVPLEVPDPSGGKGVLFRVQERRPRSLCRSSQHRAWPGDRPGDRPPAARVPRAHHPAPFHWPFVRGDRRRQTDASGNGQKQTLSGKSRIEGQVVGRDCREAVQAQARSAGCRGESPPERNPCLRRMRRPTRAACPSCGAAVAEAGQIGPELSALARPPRAPGRLRRSGRQRPRLRPFSRRERAAVPSGPARRPLRRRPVLGSPGLVHARALRGDRRPRRGRARFAPASCGRSHGGSTSSRRVAPAGLEAPRQAIAAGAGPRSRCLALLGPVALRIPARPRPGTPAMIAGVPVLALPAAADVPAAADLRARPSISEKPSRAASWPCCRTCASPRACRGTCRLGRQRHVSAFRVRRAAISPSSAAASTLPRESPLPVGGNRLDAGHAPAPLSGRDAPRAVGSGSRPASSRGLRLVGALRMARGEPASPLLLRFAVRARGGLRARTQLDGHAARRRARRAELFLLATAALALLPAGLSSRSRSSSPRSRWRRRSSEWERSFCCSDRSSSEERFAREAPGGARGGFAVLGGRLAPSLRRALSCGAPPRLSPSASPS